MWAFWNFQLKIWNRVTYIVGQWTSPPPLFPRGDYPTDVYVPQILSNLIVMTLMGGIFSISVLYFYFKVDYSKGLKPSMVMVLISYFLWFLAFWTGESYKITPNNWLVNELNSLSSHAWQFVGIPLPMSATYSERDLLFQLILNLNIWVLFSISMIGTVLSVKRYRSNLKLDQVGKIQDKSRKNLFQNLNFSLTSLFTFLILILFFIYTVVPIVYTLILSMSNAVDIQKQSIVPSDPLGSFVRNYSSVIFIINPNSSSFSSSFMISLVLGFGTSLGGMFISLPAAYAISRYKFKGRNTSKFLVLATQMFPGIILLIPQFIIWKNLGFFGGGREIYLFSIPLFYIDGGTFKLSGLLLAYFVGALAYNVWMMKGYFDTLPYDLEEAALIDGSTDLGAFLRIAIPLSAPGMVAVAIFTFLGAWNEFALAQIFVGEKNPSSSLPLMFYLYQNTSAPDNPPYFQLLSAFSILAALPIMVVFMSLQRLLTGGITSGGIK